MEGDLSLRSSIPSLRTVSTILWYEARSITLILPGEGVAVAVREVNGNETRVTGLTPGLLYTFSVTAENDVSSQDNNADARTLSITASTTEEEGWEGI